MKIHLEEHEIKQAITDYIDSQSIVLTDKKVEVALYTTRNPNGYRAEVDILTKDKETQATPADDGDSVEPNIDDDQQAIDFGFQTEDEDN